MWKVDAFKRVWLVALGCAAAEGVPVADVKQGYDSGHRYDGAKRGTEGAKNGNERERRRDSTTVTSSSIQKQYMLTEEPPPDEHQPLSGTLTRLDDDSERPLQAENDVWRGI